MAEAEDINRVYSSEAEDRTQITEEQYTRVGISGSSIVSNDSSESVDQNTSRLLIIGPLLSIPVFILTSFIFVSLGFDFSPGAVPRIFLNLFLFAGMATLLLKQRSFLMSFRPRLVKIQDRMLLFAAAAFVIFSATIFANLQASTFELILYVIGQAAFSTIIIMLWLSLYNALSISNRLSHAVLKVVGVVFYVVAIALVIIISLYLMALAFFTLGS